MLALAIGRGASPDRARALAFAALLAGNVALVATNRSHTRSLLATLLSRNVPAAAVTAVPLAFLLLALEVGPLRALLHFEATPPGEVAAALGVGAASVLWFEAVKLMRRAGRP